MRIAVIKPDHLGDLVLSIPAIKAAQKHYGTISLFVSERSKSLAHFLFPGVEVHTINFPHLARGNEFIDNLTETGALIEKYDLILWLRNDPFIHQYTNRLKANQDFINDDYFAHETTLQREMLLRHLPSYSRTELFGAIRWPEVVSRVGLSIGSGFPNNQWPLVYWLQLATALMGAGLELTLIAGPAETRQAGLLSNCFPHFHATVIGSADYASFLGDISDLDLIIATDGGTAHLCSLVKPVLSIFGSSPWRRYAPFGRENVVLTRDLSCSPCCNFSMAEINGCMSRECIVGIYPEAVLSLLKFGPAIARPSQVFIRQGTSHA